MSGSVIRTPVFGDASFKFVSALINFGEMSVGADTFRELQACREAHHEVSF